MKKETCITVPSDNPLVSVLMTAYNRQQYIGEAIESVLASTYTNFELIIVDDCSTDETVSIAKSYQAKDSRIKVYVNEKNLGDYPNRNKAAGYARGKYLKYLDSDDTILKHGLYEMVKAIEKYPEAAMAMMWVYDDTIKEPLLNSSEMALREYFIDNKWLLVGPSGCIYSTRIFFEIGGFSGRKYIGDFEFNMKTALRYPIVKMQNGLIFYRVHNGQQGNDADHSHTYRTWQYKIQNDILSNPICPLRFDDKIVACKKINRLQARRVVFYFFKSLNFTGSYKMITSSGLGWKRFMGSLLSFK